MSNEQAIAMIENQNHAAELERQELLAECHSLPALIGQHRYAVRLLRAARDGLRVYIGYKAIPARRRQWEKDGVKSRTSESNRAKES